MVGESITEYLPNGVNDLAAPNTHLPGNTQLVRLVWGCQAFAVPSWDVGFVVTKILLLGVLASPWAGAEIAGASIELAPNLVEAPDREPNRDRDRDLGRLTTPSMQAAGPESLPENPGTPVTLFVNFDGAVLRKGCGNDARRDCSSLADYFDGYVGPFTGTDVQKLAIIQAIRRDVEDFGVRVVATRPPDDQDYTMVLYGDLGEQDFAGVAPYIDCGNVWGHDTSFSQGYTSSSTGSTVILQEAAHTWGLEHVDATFDILNPFKSSADQAFSDNCYKIVANTDLDETLGVCNVVHQLFCEAGYQNSWQEMRYLFGTPVPDVSPPSLTITSPEDGSQHVRPVEVPLLGEIEDDLHPQLYDVTIFQEGSVLYEGRNAGLDLLLSNPPAGVYDLEVRIADGGGNTAEDRVRFEVLPEGSELPEPEPDTSELVDDENFGCRLTPPTSAALWLVLVAGLARRRRRGCK